MADLQGLMVNAGIDYSGNAWQVGVLLALEHTHGASRSGRCRSYRLPVDGHRECRALALAGFDIDRVKPAVACVEAKGENRQAILKYFTAHGYERIDRYLARDEVNYYFTPRSTPAGSPTAPAS